MLYVTAPQGRIEGIATLKLQHMHEMKVKGYALNKQFKTAQVCNFVNRCVAVSKLDGSFISLFVYLLTIADIYIPASHCKRLSAAVTAIVFGDYKTNGSVIHSHIASG